MATNLKAERLARFMLKKVNKAIYEFRMIEDGDRIAVAVSGGKDSLSLLYILRFRMRFVPERYSVVAIHVVGDARGSYLLPYPELEEWLRAHEIEYLVRQMFVPEGESIPMTCERCTWNRRRTLFEMARELGCNKVAFGHHLDDLAETALLNLIYHGRLETMTPCASYFGGMFKLIRPLAYVPEAEIKRFSSLIELPSPPPPCPRSEQTKRQLMRKLIEEMGKDAHRIRENIVRAALESEIYEKESLRRAEDEK
ncbi:MAG: tRNA 2-thiocytidine(32) synthetase TtcA [Armatimonadetes bacterium]|nr:tRNA 2-thiocytidine(32) synthetase TtcA [Armatimonadota bacterium]